MARGTLAEVLGRSSPSSLVKSVHEVHEDCCLSLFQNQIKLDPFSVACKQCMRDLFPLQGRADHVNSDLWVWSSQQERVGYVTPVVRVTCEMNVLAADPFQAQRQVGLLRLNVGFVCWTDAVVEGVVQEN